MSWGYGVSQFSRLPARDDTSECSDVKGAVSKGWKMQSSGERGDSRWPRRATALVKGCD